MSAIATMMPATGVDSFKHRASNCILMTIAVICICILVLCGVMIVREYALSVGYDPTICKVTNVTDKGPEQECRYCEPKDKTKEKGVNHAQCMRVKLPCLLVRVQYSLPTGIGEGLLHPDSIQAAGKFSMVGHNSKFGVAVVFI